MIKRYSLKHSFEADHGVILVERPEGTLVSYYDHEQAIKSKDQTIEQLREELEMMTYDARYYKASYGLAMTMINSL